MTRRIKTILVSLNKSEFFEGNMAMAAQIAREYNSHIIGLYVIPSAIIYTGPYGFGGPMTYTEMNRFYRSKASGLEDDFNDFIRKENLNAEWRLVNSLGTFIGDTLIEHARESDLVILGHDNSVQDSVEFEGQILAETGRPVLIVPNTPRSDYHFKKAIVGWDGSREAARAAFDAIPLLKMSQITEVTSFNAHKEREMTGDLPGSELTNSLARHGVNAEMISDKTKKHVSQALMDRAESGDLLVIGAFGHSRLRENILGGVTRKTLKQMPCPVLLSN